MSSPSAVGIERVGPDRMVQTATFAEFQYNGAAIKEQESSGGSREKVSRRVTPRWPHAGIEMRP
jgi:hypothetical protein